jgi:hypothetical protein
MGHFPDSVKRPVLTRGFEESLIAVSKAFGWQANLAALCAQDQIFGDKARTEANRLQFFGRAIATVCDGVVYYF